MPELRMKVDFGHVLTIIVLIVGGAMGWATFQAKLDAGAAATARIEKKVDGLDERITKFREQQIEDSRALSDHLIHTADRQR